MVKNPQLLKEFEDTLIQKEGRYPFNYSLLIFETLWEEGKKFGVLPLKDPRRYRGRHKNRTDSEYMFEKLLITPIIQYLSNCLVNWSAA